MTDRTDPETPLKPTQLEPTQADPPDLQEKTRSYGPRIPWGWLALIAAVLGSFALHQQYRTHRDMSVAQAQFSATRDALFKEQQRFQHILSTVHTVATHSAKRESFHNFVHPTFDLETLREKRGIYFRANRTKIPPIEDLTPLIQEMAIDALAPCLGIHPVPLPVILESGKIFTPEWDARAAADKQALPTLRVLLQEQDSRIKRDIPELREQISAQYLVVILDHWDKRNESGRPTTADVEIWDISRSQTLLSLRTKPAGKTVTVPVDVEKRFRRLGKQSWDATAYDCSIARQITDFAQSTVESPPTQANEREIP